ncbi:hypothetical protein SLOPH_2190 [Spraguea lophii 42_110]|uniref:Protein YIP n=1 Tax=Spraguea lophii (strain 42_110) TaxID=1358809 RepID=S7XPA5_SPRLO|nr:hypothetical protein SLOPH_2190 [Spraguea lophii 42_110]
MVIESRRFTERASASTSSSPSCFKQIMNELTCWKKSLMLTPVDMKVITPQVYSVLFFALFLSLQVYIFTLPFLFTNGIFSGINSIVSIFVFYMIFIIYSFLGGYFYRLFLKKENDSSYLSYVAVCLYACSYAPVCVFLTILLKMVGFIFILALALIAQFYISSCLTMDYNFTNTRDIFIFSLMTMIIEFALVSVLQVYVLSSVIVQSSTSTI